MQQKGHSQARFKYVHVDSAPVKTYWYYVSFECDLKFALSLWHISPWRLSQMDIGQGFKLNHHHPAAVQCKQHQRTIK